MPRPGRFTPNIDGPNPARRGSRNNIGDVYAVATYTTEAVSGKPAKTLRARAHLLVTVPLYMRWEPVNAAASRDRHDDWNGHEQDRAARISSLRVGGAAVPLPRAERRGVCARRLLARGPRSARRAPRASRALAATLARAVRRGRGRRHDRASCGASARLATRRRRAAPEDPAAASRCRCRRWS